MRLSGYSAWWDCVRRFRVHGTRRLDTVAGHPGAWYGQAHGVFPSRLRDHESF